MHKDTAEVVQQYLAAIGIQCELKLPDWSTRVSLGTRGQYEIAIHGVSADNNDPDGLTVVLDTTLSPSHGRSFGVQAPRTAEALARGRAEFDQAKRVDDLQGDAARRSRRGAARRPRLALAGLRHGQAACKGFTNLPGALTDSSGAMLEETWFG